MINRILLATLAVCSLYLWTGCGSKGMDYEPNVYFNDMDSHFGTHPNIVKGAAKSGYCYQLMDENYEYSSGFNKILGQISNAPFASVATTAQIFFPTPGTTCYLAQQILDPAGQLVDFQQVEITDKIGTKKWAEVALNTKVSHVWKPEYSIRIFVFNPGKARFFIDDLRVEFKAK